jgi:hypothetical protein
MTAQTRHSHRQRHCAQQRDHRRHGGHHPERRDRVDLGASGVTTGAGHSLVAAGTVTVELDAGDVLFAITGAGTSVVEVLRT